jgi:hypothetical protein
VACGTNVESFGNIALKAAVSMATYVPIDLFHDPATIALLSKIQKFREMGDVV